MAYFLGRALRGQAPRIPYALGVPAAATTPKTCQSVRLSVRRSAGLPPNALKAGIVGFFPPDFAYVRLQTSAKQLGGGGKKRKQLVILAAIKSHPTQRK